VTLTSPTTTAQELHMSAPVLDLGLLASALVMRTDALVVLVDDTGRLAAVNPATVQATGRPAESLVGEAAEVLVVPRDVPDFRRALRVAVRSGAPGSYELELAGPTEEGRRSVTWSISPIAHDPTVLACIGIDVTATRNEFEALRSRAVTDGLTGLPNRAGLVEHLAGMAGSGASVVFCDLDGFKAVNDTFGHAAGDEVLVHVARRLKRAVRGEDFVARLGGDEFVIVVPPDPNSDFEALAGRLTMAMTQPMILTGRVVATVGMSFGVSVLSPGEDPATVLTAADQDMYQMKLRRPAPTMTGAYADDVDDHGL